MSFNEYMKKSREKAGLTQETAASILNVSTQTIQNWEKDGIPAYSNWKGIIELYKLNRNEFSKKCADLVVPQEEEKDKESNIPEFIFDKETLEKIKMMILTEREQELLGMELIYPTLAFNGNFDDGYGTRNINIRETTNYFPYDYVKEIGCFELVKIKNSLHSKISGYRQFVVNKILQNPEILFNINHLTQKDYFKLSGKKDYIEDLIKVFDIIIENGNKIIIERIGYDREDRWEKVSNEQGINFEKYKNDNYFKIFVQECEDEEYVEKQEQYKKDLSFYEEHKSMMDHAPKKPRYMANKYIAISDLGHKLLNWYKENIE